LPERSRVTQAESGTRESDIAQTYDALRGKGMSKQRAARISNAQAEKRKRSR